MKIDKFTLGSAQLFLLVLLFFVMMGFPLITNAAEDEYIIRYQIDRSNVPSYIAQELTMNIAVGEANTISAQDEEGEEIPFEYDDKLGIVTVTTASSEIKLTFITATGGNPLVGSYAPAALFNNYKWAWSHGLDDNINLEGSIEQFEARGWVATLYLIGDFVDRPFGQSNLIQPARIRELLEEGWSIGNHTYRDIDCVIAEDQYEREIEFAQATLTELVENSDRPDYQITGFAAPCFLEGYHSAVQALQQSNVSTIRFNESGDRVPLVLDKNRRDEAIDDVLVYAYDDDRPIGRDGTIDEGELADVISAVDWIARNSTMERHLWYNSISHGEEEVNEGVENRLSGLIEHIYRTYGPLGTGEVWVAPADHIIGYVTMRDSVVIKPLEVTKNGSLLDTTVVREVEPETIGNLDSAGFLPTRERIADTPIPIVVEPISVAVTPEPTVETIVTPEVVEEAAPTEAPAQSKELASDDRFGNLFTPQILILLCGSIVAFLIVLAAIYWIISDRFRRRNRG